MKKKVDLLSEKMISVLTRKLNVKTYDELSGVIEEAIMSYYNISLQELNENRIYFMNDEDITNINYENYVYVYMDPRFYDEQGWVLFEDKICHFLPFYVGKGRYDRCNAHLRFSHNSEMDNKLRELKEQNLKPEIEIINQGLTNMMALNLENFIISSLKNQNVKMCNLISLNQTSRYDEKIFISNNFLEKKKNILVLKALNSSVTIREAANQLGISERGLYRKIKNLRIIKTKNGTKNYSYSFENYSNLSKCQ
jgi:hypothetical protein